MTETCFHCGLDVPKTVHLTVRYREHDQAVCCAGCQAVAQSIIDAGLGSYYEQRTADAEKASLPPDEILAQLKLYDLPEVQADFVAENEGGKEAVLLLEGITCAACVWLIEQRLLRLAGVVRVDLNYSTERARVVWRPEEVSLSDILLCIRQTGYTAQPYDAAKQEEAAQKKRKQALIRLAVAGLSMMQTMMFAVPTYLYHDIEPQYLVMLHWGAFLMVLPVMLYSAIPFYQGAWRDWRNRRVGMDTPVTLAIGLAFLAGVYALLSNAGQGMYFESIAMFVFLLLGGRYMEHIARQKAGSAAERLVKLVPAFCHRLPDYPESEVAVESAVVQLQSGDVVLVKAGEVMPVDGVVCAGESEADEAMLTGESLPVMKAKGSRVTAGTLNLSSPLIVQTTEVGGHTRLAHIVRLLDRALAQKPKLAELADRYASSFVLSLLILAVPVFLGWTWYADAYTALWITVSLLVITCPCALSLATPAALAASTGALASNGVLISGRHSLETLPQITDVVFDKTGTLTEGRLNVTAVHTLGSYSIEYLTAVAQLLEAQSEHPLAKAILNMPQANLAHHHALTAQQRLNRVGHGVSAMVEDGDSRLVWSLGKPEFVAEIAGEIPASLANWPHNGSMVVLGNQAGFQAVFLLADSVKPEAESVLAKLRQQGLRCHLLSGDREAAVQHLAQTLQLDAYRAAATPEDKLAYVGHLQAEGKSVLMVGDGINDAPVLVQADVSVAVAGGADVAREGADVILLNDSLNVLPLTILQAVRTRRIIRQNLIWASVYNLVAVPLAVVGWVTPWIAALGMSISSLLVLANALRLLNIPKNSVKPS